MRYVMKKKLLSLGSDFTIKDAEGNDVFFVDGKVLSLRDRLVFEDMQGNELAVVQQKLLSWGPTYEISGFPFLITETLRCLAERKPIRVSRVRPK